MKANKISFALATGLATFAVMSSAPHAQSMSAAPAAEDTTVRAFPRSATGSDPSTELPYAATVGRPLGTQGES